MTISKYSYITYTIGIPEEKGENSAEEIFDIIMPKYFLN